MSFRQAAPTQSVSHREKATLYQSIRQAQKTCSKNVSFNEDLEVSDPASK
jgi:hypothetical protein